MTKSKQIYTRSEEGNLSYADRVYIQNADSVRGQSTAFGELQVAQLNPVIALKFPYHINSGIVVHSGLSGHTLTQESGMAKISTDGTDNSFSVMESRDVIRYIPGQGSLVRFTALFEPSVSGQKQVVGVGDELDGFFFGCSGATFGVWHRQFGVEDFIPQSGWNHDRFDGTQMAPAIDINKGNVYQIQYQWLGYGEIIFGIEDGNTGQLRDAHHIHYANEHNIPSVNNPSFPMRVECDNNGDGAAQTIRTASMGAFTEGTIDAPTLLFGASGAGSIDGADPVHLMTVRNKATFQGKKNRTSVIVRTLSAGHNGNKDVILEINSDAIVTGQSFTDVNTNSSVIEVDSAGTWSANGTVIGGAIVSSTSNLILNVIQDNLIVRPGHSVSIFGRSTGGSTAAAVVYLTWKELY